MRKHNYAVGYRGERQCIYGKTGMSSNKCTDPYIDPLTLNQAKKLSKKIRSNWNKSIVYKLVEVK